MKNNLRLFLKLESPRPKKNKEDDDDQDEETDFSLSLSLSAVLIFTIPIVTRFISVFSKNYPNDFLFALTAFLRSSY